MSFFITKGNFLQLSSKRELSDEDLKMQIYKSNISFFSKNEIIRLLKVKKTLQDISEGIYEINMADVVEDTFSYVHEYRHHRKYHTDRNCTSLHSDFNDIEIPVEVKYDRNGDFNQKRVESFRQWFKRPEITELYNSDEKVFYDKLQSVFPDVTNIKPQKMKNHGFKEVSMDSVAVLEHKIEKLLSDSMEFCQRDFKHAKVLLGENLRVQTYWATSDRYLLNRIEYNNTGYSDEEVRKVLRGYSETIKFPMMSLLIDFYIVSFNKNLEFDRIILEKLNFQLCTKCAKSSFM